MTTNGPEEPPTETVEDKLGGLSLDESATDESLVKETKECIPEGDAVKADLSEVSVEELKADSDIVPPTETVTSETPVEEVTQTKPTMKEKISETFHKIVG